MVNGGLLLELAIERARREQLANKLKWLEKRQADASVRDARKQKRIMPDHPHATLVFHDGSTRGCFVIDISTSGVAVSADLMPAIGTPLAVGACVGRVVRHFREGFAVKFVELQDEAHIEKLVARPIRQILPHVAPRPAGAIATRQAIPPESGVVQDPDMTTVILPV